MIRESLISWFRGYKTFFMLNSTRHENFPAKNVKMPTIVGILTFVSRKNSILGLSEPPPTPPKEKKKKLYQKYFFE